MIFSTPIQLLVVDDESDLCLLTKEYLERSKDIEVDTVGSVREAMIRLTSKSYDVIVSDYQMPEVDGIEFLKSLRGSGNQIPFILFTGKGREDVVIEALNNGADAYMQKGGKPAPLYVELEHHVRAVTRRHRSEESLKQNNEELQAVNEQLAAAEEELRSQLDAIIQGQDELRKEMDFSDSIMDSLPGIYYLYDAQTLRLVRWNKNHQEVSGYTVEEMFGKHVLDWHRKENAEAVLAAIDDCMANGQASIEAPLVMKDGREISYILTGKRLDTKERSFFMGVGIDITERKRGMDELRSSQHMLSKILGSTPNLVYIYDLKEHRNLYANHEVVDFLGYTPKQIQEMGSGLFAQILHPDDVKGVMEYQDRVRQAADGDILESEYRMKRADGSWCWLRSRDLVFDRDQDGSVRNELGIAEDVTERKLAEEVLRQSEERLRRVIEHTDAGYFFIDREGRFQRVNNAWLRMHGYESSDEVIGQHFSLTQPETSVGFANQSFDILLGGDSISSAEASRLCKDGSLGYHSFSARPVIKAGEIIGLEGFLIDITENKKAEKAKRDSEERFKQLADIADEWIWEVDANGLLIYSNQVVERMLGYGLEELIGKVHFFDLKPPENREKIKKEIFATFEAKLPIRGFINNGMTKGGKIVLMETSGIPVLDESGGLIGYRGTNKDITKRKRAEDALRESEEKFRIISESSPDHIIIHDRDLRYVWVLNPQLGMTLSDMIGRTDHEILAKEDAEVLTSVKKEVMRTGMEKKYNMSLPSLDGRKEYFDGVFVPRYDVHGNVDGIIGYFRNVTETVRTQEALQEANRKLNLMTSITRHDINNQLMVLMGHLELMEKNKIDIMSKQHLHNIEMAAERISAMIKFTKTYEDIGVQTPRWQNVRDLIDGSVADVKLEKLEIVNDVPADTQVFADSLIVKAFYNLIHNAVRHGGKVTKIHFYVNEREGAHFIICEDDGVGIPADMKGKLFTRGFGKDHGLGLFLTREILAITDISINEEGEPGKGAKFVITAPMGGLRRSKDERS